MDSNKEGTLKEQEPGEWTPPTITMTPEEAQYLADQLWSAGVRPAGSKQGHWSFDAQNRHLEDMRSLVFKTAPK